MGQHRKSYGICQTEAMLNSVLVASPFYSFRAGCYFNPYIINDMKAETEKLRKYDLLANELSLVHKCKVNIIPFVLTWDGIVTTYHEKYRKDLKVSNRIEAYIQSKVLHKTLESVSLDYRRKCEDGISEREIMTIVTKTC